MTLSLNWSTLPMLHKIFFFQFPFLFWSPFPITRVSLLLFRSPAPLKDTALLWLHKKRGGLVSQIGCSSPFTIGAGIQQWRAVDGSGGLFSCRSGYEIDHSPLPLSCFFLARSQLCWQDMNQVWALSIGGEKRRKSWFPKKNNPGFQENELSWPLPMVNIHLHKAAPGSNKWPWFDP